jgi:hypothetical protein
VSPAISIDDKGMTDLVDSVATSITFGGSQLILAAATIYHEDYVPTPWQTCLVFWASCIGSFLINLFFNK